MKQPWVIFDADNTLWNVEGFYDDARNQLCSYLEGKGVSFTDSEKYQRNRDTELYETYGYSACRFARSFEDTVINYLGSNDTANEVIHCRSLALNVFEMSPKPNENLEYIFSRLKQNFKLGLLTAGEQWVQKKRLLEFHLYDEIDAIQIVEKKTIEVIERFIINNNIDKRKSWMIGDSLSSDMYPAKGAGLNVIWYQNHNWQEQENSTKATDNDFYKVRKLSDILEIAINKVKA